MQTNLKEPSENVIRFAAIMAVAFEYGMWVKDDMKRAFMGSLPHMSRAARREQERSYNKDWGRLEHILKEYSRISIDFRPEWYDRVVDRLCKVINEEVEMEVKNGA